ncbi:MAG: 5'-3' exonuclease H3TH domain-containing protein [bacterium]|nr:5'-3' exonuclease H3TH domain-containing protein [bacterium]
MQSLLLLDGNSLLHRAYYALPDWRNRSGEATAGVYGFLSMLLKAISELKPTHLIVVFDHPSPTFRHTMYVGYQTNREKDRQISEDIWGQVIKLQLVLEKMGIPVFQTAGFEADDIIGTLAKQAGKHKFQVTIITGDRDLMQLVNKQVSLYMPQKGLTDATLVDEEIVMSRMGVPPDQIIDYKGLVGDSSDNYPGVAGIGPKTAAHLLAEFRSLDNLYKHLPQVPEAARNKLVTGYEGAILSQKLATIKTDVPVTANWQEAQTPSEEKLLAVLQELGYKSLIKRLGGEVEVNTNQPKLFES